MKSTLTKSQTINFTRPEYGKTYSLTGETSIAAGNTWEESEVPTEKTKIKEWYIEKFPTDELGEELKSDITFHDLFRALETYQDVYEFIGVGDSLIRERIFQGLCDVMKCEYEKIYELWLASD